MQPVDGGFEQIAVGQLCFQAPIEQALLEGQIATLFHRALMLMRQIFCGGSFNQQACSLPRQGFGILCRMHEITGIVRRRHGLGRKLRRTTQSHRRRVVIIIFFSTVSRQLNRALVGFS
uniref:Uncharacterized protein n=1 Tax=Pseudomonas graminis TaxID=158627 RepID=A0A7C1XGL5_9PSED